MNLDDLSDDENDEISLGSDLSTEAVENVKAIAVENSFMEVRIAEIGEIVFLKYSVIFKPVVI